MALNLVVNSYQIPYPTPQNSEETIGEMAHRIMRDNLSASVVKAKARALANSVPNANAGSLRLSRLRRELKNLGTSFQIIEATKFPDITKDANEIQRDRHSGVTSYAKNRGQPDIPRKFRSMEKDQERAKELLTWIQNAISSGRMGNPGAIYAVVVHGAKNLAHAITIAGEALRHNPNNNTSPVQNFVIVNYRKKNQLLEEARPFRLYDNVN
ncbi:25302_t:CDS:2 [Dentiscutata erythropus]|uniref:25302_t:CDS:1 n=1 Tax=Dentiscutata erythropus TaxID=1348616 RepID=A0A9N9J9V2_9GLOM|nr:25302_t:CDS:2 [Dentiscutata erythropus]